MVLRYLERYQDSCIIIMSHFQKFEISLQNSYDLLTFCPAKNKKEKTMVPKKATAELHSLLVFCLVQ
jgi:hypothetical protein